MPSTLTEETIHRLAPDDKAVQAARDLVRTRSFQDLGISADGTWLLGRCKGSAVYEVSVDLEGEPGPVGRCSCPSRKLPCKHALGLMLAYLGQPKAFAVREPAAELLAKREKQAQRASKPPSAEAAPRKVNAAALAKKVAAQREGLDLLETLLLDLVSAGAWSEPARLERLERQGKQLGDAYLPGAEVLVRRLVLLGRRPGISDEVRAARASDLLAAMWATVQKGRVYLDGKLGGDDTAAEADAVLEEVLGRAWQLTELRERGYTRAGLNLLELAYERADDEARQEQVQTSHLLDLDDGALYRAIYYRPVRKVAQVSEQPSYNRPVSVAEAVVYPGFLNRRIRWEKGAERDVPLEPAHLRTAYDRASAFEPALAAFRQQLKNPLAPREATALLRCRAVGRVEGREVLEDEAGARIVAEDLEPGEPNVANLVRAAGMLERPAVLARLHVVPVANVIVAQPMAALSPEHHLRLGL
jgi:hypothetical protein